MTLTDAAPDRRVKVTGIDCRHDVKRHLGSMGLFIGVTARVVSKHFGLAVVDVMNTRICLGEPVMSEISVVYT